MKRRALISIVVAALLLGGAALLALQAFSGSGAARAGSDATAGAAESSDAGASDGDAADPDPADSGTAADTDEPEPAPVRVVPAARETIVGTVDLNGEIEAANRVSVYPDVAGTVRRIAVAEGQAVSAEAPIVFVDPSQPGSQFQESPARSPIAGIVVSLDTEIGEEVRPASAVGTVATLNDIRVTLHVPERYVDTLAVGMGGTFRTFGAGEREYRAEVSALEPTIDAETRSKETTLRIAGGATGLQPGMFVRVSLPLARSVDAVTVPFSAIVQQGGEEYVYTVEDNVARRLSVRTGIVSGDRIEIERGVQTGQSVVVSGIQELRPGRPVTVSEDE